MGHQGEPKPPSKGVVPALHPAPRTGTPVEPYFVLPDWVELPAAESAEFRTSLAKKYLPSLGTIMI
jgi:hypothetical protein